MCIWLFATNGLLAQDSTATKEQQIRFCYVFDEAYNLQDKLLTDYASRKMTLGLTFSDKKQKWAVSIGLGFKGFKFTIYNPRYTNQFLKDVIMNYSPVNTVGLDSLAGASLYNLARGTDNDRYYLGGIYSAHASMWIVYMAARLKPIINYYIASEQFVFYTPLLYYNDPTANDPKESMTMAALTHEVRVGFNPLPFKNLSTKPWYFSLQVGYKFVAYKPLSFDAMKMNQYLPDKMLNEYEKGQKLTFSLSYYVEIFRKGYH